MKAQTSGLFIQSRIFVAVTVSIGIVTLMVSLSRWQSHDPLRFVCCLGAAMLASVLKIQLPGIDGTMSLNFLIILLGIFVLNLPETLVIGCAAIMVQSIWAEKRIDF